MKPDEQRRGGDRRRKPTNPLTPSSLLGRRRVVRRVEDGEVHRYVDRYSPRVVGVVLCVLGLSLTDTVFTLEIVRRGGVELNPVMDYFLQRGPLPFLIVKYVLTVFGLLVLIVHKRFRILGDTLRVRSVLLGFLFFYVGVIVWEGYLLFQSS